MHTPSSYMYSDLRSFGGITNKEAASELLTDQTPCGNGAPRDRINERTFLSRQIVHATPSQVHPEYYGDFHQSAQTITSKIASNLAMPCAYHEVIKHYGGQAAKEMGALLRHYSLDGNLYANAIRRINASPMPESSDKAVLLVMMFLITGCLADPEIAAKLRAASWQRSFRLRFRHSSHHWHTQIMQLNALISPLNSALSESITRLPVRLYIHFPLLKREPSSAFSQREAKTSTMSILMCLETTFGFSNTETPGTPRG